MKVTLLKSFGSRGFKGEIKKDGSYVATDNSGNELIQGIDFLIEDIDVPDPLIIISSNGEIYQFHQNKKG